MIADLVTQLYTALAAGDRTALETLISPEFIADFSPGYGPPIGGRHVGTDAIDHGWWAIGRRWRARAEPEEYIPAHDGRLLVIGSYRGRARSAPEAEPFTAPFAHLWAAESGRLTRLVQITDTTMWNAEPS